MNIWIYHRLVFIYLPWNSLEFFMLQFPIYSECNIKFDERSITACNWIRMCVQCGVFLSKLLVNVYGHEKIKHVNR